MSTRLHSSWGMALLYLTCTQNAKEHTAAAAVAAAVILVAAV